MASPACASIAWGQLTDGPLRREFAGQPQMLGAKNLLVPAGNVICVARSLIIHYIEDHSYRPPDEFVEALLAIDPALDQYPAACQRLWHGS